MNFHLSRLEKLVNINLLYYVVYEQIEPEDKVIARAFYLSVMRVMLTLGFVAEEVFSFLVTFLKCNIERI